jgi:hypothetical protein
MREPTGLPQSGITIATNRLRSTRSRNDGRPSRSRRDCAVPPPTKWQEQAQAFAERCAEKLWMPAHRWALEWLRKRALSDESIRSAGMGCNPCDTRVRRNEWGLDAGPDIWLPCGITIPWEIGGKTWCLNIRRLGVTDGGPKYIGPAGWSNGLYRADDLRQNRPVLLVEGEFDAITVRQEAGDIVTAVATGSTSGARNGPWMRPLQAACNVLAAFDADEAGDAAARYWTKRLQNARRWRPYWEDVNKMHMEGVNVREWILRGLDAFKETKSFQTRCP